MVKSYSRGHSIYFDNQNNEWRYSNDNTPVSVERPCKKCGMEPTKEGYDACLGYIPGATSACCGHGVLNKFVVMENIERN